MTPGINSSSFGRMKSLGAILLALSFSLNLYAENDFKKFERGVHNTVKKIGSYVDGRIKANPHQAEEVKKALRNTKETLRKAAKDTDNELDRWFRTEDESDASSTHYQTEWNAYTKRNNLSQVEQQNLPSAAAKNVGESGRRLFKTFEFQINEWNKGGPVPTLDQFVTNFEAAIKDYGLQAQDLIFAVGDDGQNLLHVAVANAYEQELKRKQELQDVTDILKFNPSAAPAPLANNEAYKLNVFLIWYFCENTNLASMKDKSGISPVGFLLRQNYRSWSLLEAISDKDRSGLATTEIETALATEAQ